MLRMMRCVPKRVPENKNVTFDALKHGRQGSSVRVTPYRRIKSMTQATSLPDETDGEVDGIVFCAHRGLDPELLRKLDGVDSFGSKPMNHSGMSSFVHSFAHTGTREITFARKAFIAQLPICRVSWLPSTPPTTAAAGYRMIPLGASTARTAFSAAAAQGPSRRRLLARLCASRTC